MRAVLFVSLLVVAVALLALPSGAIKVYVNPSIQTNNTSPDGTYNEGYAMQDVSDRLMAKLTNRGFSARDSNWLSLADACNDAVAWGANAFLALHTNAGGGGWGTGHGTEGFYYQSSGGWHDPNDVVLADNCVHKCVQKFSAWGRGYDRGTFADWPYFGYNLYVLSHTPNMNATLTEGLFHDNYDDVQVLKSTAGKDAYATAMYEATCQFYGWNPYPTADIIIDNTSGSFTCSSGWATGTMSADKYGSDYRYRSTQALSDPAKWTPNITAAGNWEVFAWWPQGTNRSTAAPYIINYNGGSANVKVNQQINGGKWNSLGTYNFAAGTGGNVQLSCWAPSGYVVMADAVKFVKR